MKRVVKFFLMLFIGAAVTAIIALTLFQNRGERGAVSKQVDDVTFNFAAWEAEAVSQKITLWLTGAAWYVPADNQPTLVRDYLTAIGTTQQLEGELEQLYATSSNNVLPDEDVQRAIVQNLAIAQAEKGRLQPLAEEILQNQVGAILEQEQFNQWLPPVQMHMTPLPQLLIISPRDNISQLYVFPLEHGLIAPQKAQIEQAIFEDNDLSAIIQPIGGMAVYPTMIQETPNLAFIADTIAHEWVHVWLFPRPLGYRYATDPDIRTINETTASIFGKEMGERVIKTYYMNRATMHRPKPKQSDSPFDFRAEMRETREQVDAYLAAGQIEQAEAYMEMRRQIFVENGYALRKLNQAYFAFHGAYADTDGATGSDPIGPAVVAIRAQSDSLRTFMDRMAGVKNRDQLLEMAGN